MRFRHFIFIIFISFGFNHLYGQKCNVDSLKQIISESKHDSTIVNVWAYWSIKISFSDPELDREINENIDSLCAKNLNENQLKSEKQFFQKARSIALNNLGFIYSDLGNYPKAIKCHSMCMEIQNELGDKLGVAGSLNNIGNVVKFQGNYALAIEYMTKSLKIKEELGNKRGVANSLNNIGTIYRSQGEHESAMSYYQKSLAIKKEIGYKKGIASSLNNIGIVHCETGDFKSAINFFEQSLKIKENMGNKKGMSSSLNNIGDTYIQMGEFDKALPYCQRSLDIREEIGYKKGIGSSLANLGLIYESMGNYTKAIEISERSLSIAKEIGNLSNYKDASFSMWKIHKKAGNYKEALVMHELYLEMKDSIEREENQKEILRQEYKYEYEQQAVADSVRNAEKAKVQDAELAQEKAENEKQQQQSYFLYGGLTLALIFGIFIFNRFQVTNKQKSIIEDQKQIVDEAFDELEQKNSEIIDSINYAKRIQTAILPTDESIKAHLPNSFILYKPKDIVAGDFYWLSTSRSEPYKTLQEPKENGNPKRIDPTPTTSTMASSPSERTEERILLAAADCTGHGVPGAMVSVVCNNGLNRSVREFGLTDPGKILDKTRELVIQEFEKSKEEVKDGMDIALVSLSISRSLKSIPTSSEEGAELRSLSGAETPVAQLKFAGAHNPLWIIRKNGLEIEEIKANKQPIGKFDNPKPYTTHVIDLNEGDQFYIFTDGYTDQFGGEKGKKFKTANFKKLLLSIRDHSMDEQYKMINENFNNWKGVMEQLDDVCVIGVRV